MIRGVIGSKARRVIRATMVALLAVAWCVPAVAQPKKGSWEVFIYFGSYFENDVPSAKQFGEVNTYRVAPQLLTTTSAFSFPATDPNNPDDVLRRNLGRVGGQTPNDPNYPFVTGAGPQLLNPPCSLSATGPPNHGLGALDPSGDPRAPYFDECDADQEARWLYNASGIETNGRIERDSSEFMLGIRGGYNITRHWEVEVDLGFGKQRLDLTQNLDPLLTVSTNDVTNTALANKLAKFYEFTWANLDYPALYLTNAVRTQAIGEHPAVIASRKANDPAYTIPVYFPTATGGSGALVPGETFADVTGFVNRIFQDPTAFRNRGNQINIDQFTLTGSVNYNFNTDADSRIVPYVSAGLGRLFRNFDSPYEGDDSTFYTYGGGVRFFVNEIFSFRADARAIAYADDTFLIEGSLQNYNVPDRQSNLLSTICFRDNREIRPPCLTGTVPASHFFPNLNGGGGNASIEVEAEQDDYFELRIGFDVVLGGK